MRHCDDEHRMSNPIGHALRTIAVVVAVLLWPAAAHAARPAEVARTLERSPLFVDPAYSDAVGAGDRKALRRELEALGGPTRLILAPVVPGDAADGRARTLIALVRERLRGAGEDAGGSYLVIDDGYVSTSTFSGDTETVRGPAGDAASLVNGRDSAQSYREPVGATALELVRQLRRSPKALAADVVTLRTRQEREYRDRQSKAGADGGDNGTLWALIAVVAVVLAAGAAAVAVLLRRRGARVADGPLPVIPDRVFEHARAARRADLREQADQQLVALAGALDDQDVPDDETAQEAYQEALDAMTAARRRLSPDAPSVDLVGVLVLVDRARGLLASAAAIDAGRRPPAPEPLCTFNPLHGRASGTVEWKPDLRVPACATCTADLRAGRTPDALRDGDRPYFEADTVWARTGYGALTGDLVARVSRGER